MPTPIRRTEVIQTEIKFREEEYSFVDDDENETETI